MASGDDQGREDRRRAERAPVNAEFESLTAATFISDLSELGVFVQTNRRAAIGTVVQLNFTVLLDDPVVLSARGRVVRHQANPPGMGIEFIQPSSELLLRIHDVVSRQRPRELGSPVGAPDPDDEVTVHRAPAPDASDPFLETEKTGLYPSIRIQIRQEADEDEAVSVDDFDDEPTVAASAAGSGSGRPQTLNLKATDVEIVDDDEDEDFR